MGEFIWIVFYEEQTEHFTSSIKSKQVTYGYKVTVSDILKKTYVFLQYI